MRKRDIYLTAAKRIADGTETYSCNALGEVVLGYGKAGRLARDLYASTMCPRKVGNLEVEDVRIAVTTGDSYTYEDMRDFRVLLLCMMAAVVYDL